MSAWWRDLSDAELRARLVQRDVSEDAASWLVENRDNQAADVSIREILEGRA